MATYTQAYANACIDDDTRFQTWTGWVSSSLTSLGWAKTSDTGQINTSTVLAPTAADSSQGYEIRTSNDSFDDIYLKLEYGSGQNTYSKGFWVTLGTGSDGSGNLTGVYFGRYQFQSQLGQGGGTKPGDDFLSGDGSTIRLWCTDDANALYSLGLFISRSHNHAGTNDDQSVWVWWQGYNNSIRCWCSGPKPHIESSLGRLGISSIRFSDAVGDASNNPVYPVTEINPNVGHVTSKHFKVGWDSLFTHQSSYTIDSVTYRNVFGNTTGANNWSTATPASMCLLMRYE
jgi:hypothetical protein